VQPLWGRAGCDAVAIAVDEILARFEALRAGDTQFEVELLRSVDIGLAHVVAIADPGHGFALDAAAMLDEVWISAST